MALASLSLDREKFVELLKRLIGEVQFLQNNPPDHIPKEDRAGRHVLDVLQPLSVEEGGVLSIQHVSYAEGRGNIIVEYPGSDKDKIMSFVGCHLDVVTANPEDWDFDPFSLSVEGGKLRGRGTTDCLGHVALLTELFRQLGSTRPALASSVVGVFIANEENATDLGIGVDALVTHGLLDKLKGGPLFWVDTADKQPCIGTGGMAAWRLKTTGKVFHSGLAHKVRTRGMRVSVVKERSVSFRANGSRCLSGDLCDGVSIRLPAICILSLQAINPIELGFEALAEIQRRFYRDFPVHPREARYGFVTPSTIKPTQVSYPGGSVNQIPGEMTICGDIRVTPFYSVASVVSAIQGYVEDINANLNQLPTHGPVSKYDLPDEGLRGRVELSFDDAMMSGVACRLDSVGFHALCNATKDVFGSVKPYSITGSLPCIRDLQDAGFDVQTMGYGVMSTYHAKNEYALIEDFEGGFKVMTNIIAQIDSGNVVQDPSFVPAE